MTTSSNSAPARVVTPPVVRFTRYIDPTAPAGGNGSLAHPYNTWNIGSLAAGGTYLMRGGTTYAGTITVGTAGTVAAPIVIGVYGSGGAPTLTGSVNFSNAAYARISGFKMSNANAPSVVIQEGSNHIQVYGNTITNSQVGVWIGTGAGGDSVVRDNIITNPALGGILVGDTTASTGHEISLIHNTISGSGLDGIQLQANHIIVTANRISDSGNAAPGTSGIQVYAPDANAGSGQFNTITGNVLLNNHDIWMQDGNGILLDQWTANNLVANNFSMGNDGAGIGLYDSSNNVIKNNVTIGNGVDTGHTHTAPGELVLNEVFDLTRSNVISGNTLLSQSLTEPAAFVDPAAAAGGNSFSGNVLENLAGGDIYSLAGVHGGTLADWNTMLGGTDSFSGVHLNMSKARVISTYSFAPNTQAMIDGHALHLVGWSPTTGLQAY